MCLINRSCKEQTAKSKSYAPIVKWENDRSDSWYSFRSLIKNTMTDIPEILLKFLLGNIILSTIKQSVSHRFDIDVLGQFFLHTLPYELMIRNQAGFFGIFCL